MPSTLEDLTARRLYDPLQIYHNAVSIETDGACRNNGQPTAKAACGIVYSFLSPSNEAFLVPGSRATSQRAELYAALVALNTAKKFQKVLSAWGTQNLILKTDSAYLVDSMTNFINKWRRNGYLPAHDRPVANEDLFRRIDILIFDLCDKCGVQVRFLKVPRKQNQAADKLANAVLNEACVPWMSPPTLNIKTLNSGLFHDRLPHSSTVKANAAGSMVVAPTGSARSKQKSSKSAEYVEFFVGTVFIESD